MSAALAGAHPCLDMEWDARTLLMRPGLQQFTISIVHLATSKGTDLGTRGMLELTVCSSDLHFGR
jgi:hypothetical protein